MTLTTITATVVGTLLLLTLPIQLHGLPGHLRTHDGAMADNQELENAVIQALLAMSQQSTSNQKFHSADNQQHPINQQYLPIYQQYPVKQQYPVNQQYPINQQYPENQQYPINQQYPMNQQYPVNQQYPIVKQQYPVNEQHHSMAENVNKQNKTAVLQKILKEMTRDQMICQRRQQQAQAQQNVEAQQNTAAQCYEANAQVSGVTIEYCGTAGVVIQNALRFGLAFIPGGDTAYGVYIACAEQPTYPCTRVRVDVPADSVKADVDVCDYGMQSRISYYM